jgi:transposase InsO family protein
MPWKECDRMSLRQEFVMFASQQNFKMNRLCKRFGISRKTGYKWLKRAQEGEGLQDHSTRPLHSPNRTSDVVEGLILHVRDAHPSWGGRTIRGHLALRGIDNLPMPSTITRILQRNGRISTEESAKHIPWIRFEREAPNELWQMDFKGHFPVGSARCHPLTVLDDHSRFCVCLKSCCGETRELVQSGLVEVFRRYGLPDQINVDNGPPWGWAGQPRSYLTSLVFWLIRQGIIVSFSRPDHPQTNGKIERFHRTLKAEVIQTRYFKSFSEVQSAFDNWLPIYNTERPNQAIEGATPITRYRPSTREYCEKLPEIIYSPDDVIRKVSHRATCNFRGRDIWIGKAFRGQPVAIRATIKDDVFEIYFCRQLIRTITLSEMPKRS